MMNDPIFDLEQEILECWGVTKDIDLVTKHFVDSPEWEGMDGKLCDELMNKYFGIKELYELKFDRLWNTFEKVCKEYHHCRKLCGTDREKQLEEMFNESENVQER